VDVIRPRRPRPSRLAPRPSQPLASATHASRATGDAGFRAKVWAWIRRIPKGRVATYGQISLLAGHPRRARMVGQALANLPPGESLPWHRVVNAQGAISARGGRSGSRKGSPESRQRHLLEAEGIVFKNGRIDLPRYRWVPEAGKQWLPVKRRKT
jgi:methylated-DNA-protein-cysteine methyltransferase-like protein